MIRSLGIPKSTLYYKPKRSYGPSLKGKRRKNIPLPTQTLIKEITGNKATYGIPRVQAILNRDHHVYVSKYLMHRHMKDHNLLIKQGRKRGSSRPHTGVISVDVPNTRWASDITSIKCWNGEKLRVAIIIDCCDRSIIAWKAGKHMQACDLELMVQEALINRFGDAKVPLDSKLEFLHDNGPEYIEKKFKQQLVEWGLTDCKTPTYSPQSNGICEAFNATFKRDYVYQSCLETAQSVYDQIQGWIDEYNEYAPHSALKMKTPNEYYLLKNAA